MTSSCRHCSRTIDPVFDYRTIVAYERKARTGSRRGGSDVTLRTPTGEWACRVCVGRLRDGLSVEQGSLLP